MLGIVRVILLKDVSEKGLPLDHELATAKAAGVGRFSPAYPRVKVAKDRKGRRMEFREGAILRMPRSGAEKYVSRGVARYLDGEGE